MSYKNEYVRTVLIDRISDAERMDREHFVITLGNALRDGQKIQAIKNVRHFLSCPSYRAGESVDYGLKEAKDLVEKFPTISYTQEGHVRDRTIDFPYMVTYTEHGEDHHVSYYMLEDAKAAAISFAENGAADVRISVTINHIEETKTFSVK